MAEPTATITDLSRIEVETLRDALVIYRRCLDFPELSDVPETLRAPVLASIASLLATIRQLLAEAPRGRT